MFISHSLKIQNGVSISKIDSSTQSDPDPQALPPLSSMPSSTQPCLHEA